jgi:hypothetical protein
MHHWHLSNQGGRLWEARGFLSLSGAFTRSVGLRSEWGKNTQFLPTSDASAVADLPHQEFTQEGVGHNVSRLVAGELHVVRPPADYPRFAGLRGEAGGCRNSSPASPCWRDPRAPTHATRQGSGRRLKTTPSDCARAKATLVWTLSPPSETSRVTPGCEISPAGESIRRLMGSLTAMRLQRRASTGTPKPFISVLG